uniref:Uncharacterized protein n=1 Tax=Arundo donax TaxID=35708 RepID=A0A0A9E2X5_ARUDO
MAPWNLMETWCTLGLYCRNYQPCSFGQKHYRYNYI